MSSARLAALKSAERRLTGIQQKRTTQTDILQASVETLIRQQADQIEARTGEIAKQQSTITYLKTELEFALLAAAEANERSAADQFKAEGKVSKYIAAIEHSYELIEKMSAQTASLKVATSTAVGNIPSSTKDMPVVNRSKLFNLNNQHLQQSLPEEAAPTTPAATK